jgi:hypothetical protein
MENLTIITKQNIDEYNIEQSDYESILCYMEKNAINAYTRFEFAVDDTNNQMYMSHVMLGESGEWKPYKTISKK